MLAMGTTTKSHGLLIGEVADQARVNIQTLRYYERRGILGAPPRTRAGYRRYPIETVRLIRFIKRAQELGFTLEEAEELLHMRTADTRNSVKVRALAAAKMKDIAEKIRQLQAMSNALGQLVSACTCELPDVECPILEALDDTLARADLPSSAT